MTSVFVKYSMYQWLIIILSLAKDPSLNKAELYFNSNESFQPEKVFLAQQRKQNLFHLPHFSLFSFFMRKKVQRLCNFLHIHGEEAEKRQRDSTLCFLMKHFPPGADCPPRLYFFLLWLSIKQNVERERFWHEEVAGSLTVICLRLSKLQECVWREDKHH